MIPGTHIDVTSAFLFAAIGLAIGLGCGLARRRAPIFMAKFGGVLWMIAVLSTISVSTWVACGGGRGGEFFDPGPAILLALLCTIGSAAVTATIVGVTQQRPNRDSLDILASGLVDVLALGAVAALASGASGFAPCVGGGWMVANVVICIMQRYERGKGSADLSDVN